MGVPDLCSGFPAEFLTRLNGVAGYLSTGFGVRFGVMASDLTFHTKGFHRPADGGAADAKVLADGFQ